MRRLRVLLLIAYVGAFLAATTVWIVFRLRKPASVAFPPTGPGWVVVWGRSFVEFRHWSAPIPTTQVADPQVMVAAPASSGILVRAGSAPADLYAHSRGYAWSGGQAWAFRGIGLHYHVIWWLTAPAPLLAAIMYARHRRRWRLAGERCVACGYDLRATPERCPECGRVAGEGVN